MELKNYIKESTYINAKTVKTWAIDERLVTVTGEGQESRFTDPKTKEEKVKPQIPVLRLADGTKYLWTLSDTAIKELSAEFETSDTQKWVGGVIKLVTRQFTVGDTVTGVLIQKPKAQ